MAQVRLFASVREAAGRSHDEVPGATVADVLDGAVARYGTDFERLLAQCRVWVNGEPVPADSPVTDDDEVAVLPPVSGG
jgi:MoaD family protein